MIDVVVADDNALIREGVARVLERGGVAVVVAQASNTEELVVQVETHRPGVVITDIEMPPDSAESGLQAAITIRTKYPEIGVIVLSQFLEDDYALSLVGHSARGVGYLLKEKIADPDVIHDAVVRVAAGETVLDSDVIARLVSRSRPRTALDTLTPREREVLALMAEGRSNAGIARDLVVSVPAVERHITNIFPKLGLHQSTNDQHRRVVAVLTYLQG